MIDLKLAQNQMIEEQLIARGIQDKRVLAAMRQIPRHKFVPSVMIERAYEDKPIPIGYQQTISQPYIVAHMTELLQLPDPNDFELLEVGTGSGYHATILSHLVRHVYTVERIKPLAEQARQCFADLRVLNIESHISDGGYGWSDYAPYDAIIVTAAAPFVPPPLLDQLVDGGVLLAPIGPPKQPQYLVRMRRVGNKVQEERLTSVAFVPLLGEHGWAE